MSQENAVNEYESGFPAMRYRPSESACGYEYKIVKSSEEEKNLGSDWYGSPADFGVETCAGAIPDPDIAAKRAELDKVFDKADPVKQKRANKKSKSVQSDGDAA